MPETHTSLRADATAPSHALSKEEISVIMNSIRDIFQLDEEPAVEHESMEDDDVEPVVDLVDQERKTAKLKSLLSPLAHLWWSDSEHMDTAAELLADGSRDPKWRLPIGDSGVLDFFLEILSAHPLRHTLKIQVLRLIGNSCADTDENRARVVSANYLPLLASQLQHTSLLPFAIPVLYNICIDYEPAQTQASQSLLGKTLIELISSSRFRSSMALLGYSCKMLGLLASQPTEVENAPEDAAGVLLKIAANRELHIDVDDFISLANTAVLYLQHTKFQQAIITHGFLDAALSVLAESYSRFDSRVSIKTAIPDEDEESIVKSLADMRGRLTQALSDISALPEFEIAVSAGSTFRNSLRRWLSNPQSQLQVCACIMLGNLARSDTACEEFVQVSRIHVPLIAIITNANDSQLLHAALGFLKNLALPLGNKLPIGEAGIFDVLPRLWLLDTLQQVQFSSISLSRQLLIGTYDNIQKITQRLSVDPDSPANMRSKLSLLIALFQRTDVEPIKMEISRLVTAICRTYNSRTGSSTAEYEEDRQRFLQIHPDIGAPLGFMVSQTKWPVVRSEGWFVFALMARFPDGAQCISDMMQDVQVFQPLVELLTGKDLIEYQPDNPLVTSPSLTTSSLDSSIVPSLEETPPEGAKVTPPGVDMARADRENALVLVSELLKNRGSEMALMRKTMFEELLQGGGNMILSYQESMAQNTFVAEDRRPSGGYNVQDLTVQSFNELS